MSSNRPHKLPSDPSTPKAKKTVVPSLSKKEGTSQSQSESDDHRMGLKPAPEPHRLHEKTLSSQTLQTKTKTKKTEKEVQRQEQQILQTLFNFQTVLPLIQNASRQPNEDQQLEMFKKLLYQYDEQSLAWTQALTPDTEQQAWIRPQLMRLMTQLGHVPKPDAFLPLLETLPYQAPQSFEAIHPKLAYQVALAQASMPLMRAQMMAEGGRSHLEQDFLDLMKMVGEHCEHVLQEWAPASLHTQAKQQLFEHLMSEAGKLMAQIWLKHAQVAQQQLSKKSPLEQQNWKKQNPEGMPLAPLKEEFQVLFSRLQKLSKMVE